MSDSLKSHNSRAQDQKPSQTRTKYPTRTHFPPNFTLHQFTPTSGVGGSTHPKGNHMTYEQYVNLKNQYAVMIEELSKYNEFRSSQPRSTTLQYPQKLNLDTNQSDSQKTEE